MAVAKPKEREAEADVPAPTKTFTRIKSRTFGFRNLLQRRIEALEEALGRKIEIRQSNGKKLLVPIRALELHPDEKSEMVRCATEALSAAKAIVNEPQARPFEMKESADLCERALLSLAARNLSGVWKLPRR